MTTALHYSCLEGTINIRGQTWQLLLNHFYQFIERKLAKHLTVSHSFLWLIVVFNILI